MITFRLLYDALTVYQTAPFQLLLLTGPVGGFDSRKSRGKDSQVNVSLRC